MVFFYQAQNWCQRHLNCGFSAKLHESSIKKLKDFIEGHMLRPHSLIDVKKTGLINMAIDCSQEESASSKKNISFMQVLEEYKLKKFFYSYCLHEKNKDEFFFKTKMVIVKESVAQKNGFDSLLKSSLSFNHLSLDFSSKIDLLIQEKKIKLIAQPSIFLSLGLESRIKSGGELPFEKEGRTYSRSFSTTSWKAYGMDLKLTVFNFDDNKFRVNYNLSVKVPSYDSLSSFRSYEISGSKIIQLEHSHIVGEIKYLTHHQSHKDFDFLQKIPIISPLFSYAFSQKGKNHLYLIFTLKKKRSF